MKKNILDRLFSFGTYIVVGGISYISNIVLTYVLTEFVGWWYMSSIIVGTIFSWTVMFILNLKYTFNNHQIRVIKSAYLKNILLYIILAPLGWSLIYIMTSVVGIYYLLSQTVVVMAMSIISFILTRRYIFKVN